MNAIEIVGGVVLLITCIIIVLMVMLQETKSRGMSAMTGGDPEMMYGKGRAKTKEILLNKTTRVCAVLFFAISLSVTLLSVLQ